MTGGERAPVTVIVPIYDDPEGARACILSLLETVDVSRDRVLICNDVGPQVDVMERLVLGLIEGRDGFSYVRNARNLGFVGNCNRAVLELDDTGNDILLLNSDTVTTEGFVDEMAAVLRASPRHGVVAPRSNNATIASLPHAVRTSRQALSVERSRIVHDAVSPLLPRFTVVPVAMGFCFLVRRDLIDEYGFFDERFSPGYGEENDFCLRVNEHGYLSVLANRALVFHTGSTSFSGDRGPSLRLAHEKVLVERYPHYVGSLDVFHDTVRDPVDRFADVFAPHDAVIRVAFEAADAASAETAVSLAASVVAELGDDVVATVLTSSTTTSRLDGRTTPPGVSVVDRRRSSVVFDVVVPVGAPSDLTSLVRAVRLAPRWLAPSAPPTPGPWRTRLRSARDDASARLLTRYADETASSSPGDLAAALVALASRPVDVDLLRDRWRAVIDTAIVAGVITYPRRASRQRRVALMLGAKSPRLSARLRQALGRL
jgi:GT2 family glycosyltransferase